MECERCGGKCKKGKNYLCPLSFGVALGITCAIAVGICFAWLAINGVSPEMAQHFAIKEITWAFGLKMAFYWLLKGFFFGLVLALLYDCIICCCKGRRCGCCCKQSSCNCSCNCCSKPSVK